MLEDTIKGGATMQKTKMICTMGPACDSVDILRDMIQEGMTVARLNMAHGELEDHATRIRNIVWR